MFVLFCRLKLLKYQLQRFVIFMQYFIAYNLSILFDIWNLNLLFAPLEWSLELLLDIKCIQSLRQKINIQFYFLIHIKSLNFCFKKSHRPKSNVIWKQKVGVGILVGKSLSLFHSEFSFLSRPKNPYFTVIEKIWNKKRIIMQLILIFDTSPQFVLCYYAPMWFHVHFS